MIPDTVIHIYYRGFLKSCNYSCSYCPFAKRPVSQKELEKDKEAISRFILWVKRQKNTLSIMFVPYGEALMHIHYIKAFASLSKMPHVTAISCQTNLSLNADKFIKRLNEENADLSKINLWTTFHSEMVNKENFVEKIHYLNQHIDLCAGIVGSPQTIAEAADLRKLLPESVYLWVNAMDRIYLATALPFIYAMRKCKTIRAYLSGGIFANGTDIRDIDSKYRHVVSMLPINISVSKGVRTLVLRIKILYIKTMYVGKIEPMTRLYQRLSQKQDDKYHILFEDGIVSLTDKAATKLFGILHLCNQLKLNQNGVMVIGNGENDIEMLSRFNHSVAVLSASNEVKRHAAYTMDIKHRPIFIK